MPVCDLLDEAVVTTAIQDIKLSGRLEVAKLTNDGARVFELGPLVEEAAGARQRAADEYRQHLGATHAKAART